MRGASVDGRGLSTADASFGALTTTDHDTGVSSRAIVIFERHLAVAGA